MLSTCGRGGPPAVAVGARGSHVHGRVVAAMINVCGRGPGSGSGSGSGCLMCVAAAVAVGGRTALSLASISSRARISSRSCCSTRSSRACSDAIPRYSVVGRALSTHCCTSSLGSLSRGPYRSPYIE